MNKKQAEYFWVAETHGGNILQESFGNTLREVRNSNLKYFVLVMPGQENSKIIVNLGEGKKLIYGKTKFVNPKWTLFRIGWRRGKERSVAYIYPGGGIELNNDESTLSEAFHKSLIKQLEDNNN